MTRSRPNRSIFENKVTGGRIPSEYIPSVEKGFRDSLHKGPVAGYEVIGVQMRLQDGSYHDVDSSTMAFEICARDCFRETFKKADPVLLEPIMKVEVEIPTEFQGPVTGAISSKRGVILGTETRSGYTIITAEVPLAEMFGYSNDLRSRPRARAGSAWSSSSIRSCRRGSRRRSSRKPRPRPRPLPRPEIRFHPGPLRTGGTSLPPVRSSFPLADQPARSRDLARPSEAAQVRQGLDSGAVPCEKKEPAPCDQARRRFFSDQGRSSNS